MAAHRALTGRPNGSTRMPRASPTSGPGTTTDATQGGAAARAWCVGHPRARARGDALRSRDSRRPSHGRSPVPTRAHGAGARRVVEAGAATQAQSRRGCRPRERGRGPVSARRPDRVGRPLATARTRVPSGLVARISCTRDILVQRPESSTRGTLPIALRLRRPCRIWRSGEASASHTPSTRRRGVALSGRCRFSVDDRLDGPGGVVRTGVRRSWAGLLYAWLAIRSQSRPASGPRQRNTAYRRDQMRTPPEAQRGLPSLR